MEKYFTKADMDALARKDRYIIKELKKTITKLQNENAKLKDNIISLEDEIAVLKNPELLDHVTED